MDPSSGNLTVKNGTLLDREKQAMYYLMLQATDGGNLSTTTTLEITLLDINDNPPVVQGSYNVFVPEVDGNVSVTIQVRATRDLAGDPGEGSRPPLHEVSDIYFLLENQELWSLFTGSARYNELKDLLYPGQVWCGTGLYEQIAL